MLSFNKDGIWKWPYLRRNFSSNIYEFIHDMSHINRKPFCSESSTIRQLGNKMYQYSTDCSKKKLIICEHNFKNEFYPNYYFT